MVMPTVQEMMDAMSSPVVPLDATTEATEKEREGDISTNTELLLDIVKSVARIESRLGGAAQSPAAITGMPVSQQLEY
jgi:hypothetical protein